MAIADADLWFDRFTGNLICWATGDTWKCRSGNARLWKAPAFPRNWREGDWGTKGEKGLAADPLPAGRYYTDVDELKRATSHHYCKPGYTDACGFPWFLHIIRSDSGIAPTSDAKQKRSQFGIHPDGGNPGTKGCIGLLAADTKPIYRVLKELIAEQTTIWIKVL